MSATPQPPRRYSRSALYVKSPDGLRVRDLKVRKLIAKLRRVVPWIGDADVPAVRGWAELEVLSDLAHAYLRRDGILTAKGEPRRLLTEFRQLKQAQLMYARELGLTPAARTAIKASIDGTAFDLAAQVAALGREEDGAPSEGALSEQQDDGSTVPTGSPDGSPHGLNGGTDGNNGG